MKGKLCTLVAMGCRRRLGLEVIDRIQSCTVRRATAVFACGIHAQFFGGREDRSNLRVPLCRRDHLQTYILCQNFSLARVKQRHICLKAMMPE